MYETNHIGKENGRNYYITLIIQSLKNEAKKTANEVLLKKALKNLSCALTPEKISPEEKTALLKKFLDLKNSINYKKVTHSIGMFVSKMSSELIYFDIPLQNTLTIGKSFEINDILLPGINNLPGYILTLSDLQIRLFKLKGEEAQEIKNKFFPHKIKNYPVKSSAKFLSELKITDKEIRKNISDKNLPILICGSNEMLSSYKKINRNYFSHSYYFELDLDKSSLYEIGKFAYGIIKKLYETTVENAINQVEKNRACKHL